MGILLNLCYMIILYHVVGELLHCSGQDTGGPAEPQWMWLSPKQETLLHHSR